MRERLERREPVKPSGDGLDDAGIAQGIERLPVDAEAQRFGHAEAAAMSAEQLDPTLEGSGAHGDIVPSNFQKVNAICPQALSALGRGQANGSSPTRPTR